MTKISNFSQKDLSQIPTYESGIAQASAHRAVTRHVSDYLSRYDLSSMQWFTIGIIFQAGPEGIRLSHLAKRLSTTMPYVTTTLAALEARGIVQKVTHADDSRIKLVTVTSEYLGRIQQIEDGLRDYLRVALYKDSGITRDELKVYISVLYKMAGNAPL